jgi:uncharacterized protein YbaP (TraB family)
MRRLVLLLLLAIASATPSLSAQAAARAQAAQKHFLWAIKAPSAPPTYLLGSLHMLSADYYPLSPVIERAFAQSTVLIEEIDLDEVNNPMTTLQLLGKALLTDGRTLDQIIAPDLYKQVVVKAEAAGLPIAAIERMKPWMAAATLTTPSMQAAGFDPGLGIDKHFFDRAKQAGIERRALETVAYQFDRLDQLPPAQQEAFLRSVINDIDTQVSSVKTMADAWSRGDTKSLEQILLGAMRESPEIYERLLVERNRNWVAPVEVCIKQKQACFVVVGAAHLVGADSLVGLLQKKGYTVDQQ